MLRVKAVGIIAAALLVFLGSVVAYSVAGKPVVRTPRATATAQPAADSRQAAPGRASATAPVPGGPDNAEEDDSQIGGRIGAPAQLTPAAGARAQPRRRPIAVMIDNYQAARPQSGLDRADVVYEALAEGGIPRFMAIYSRHDAAPLGPVRSARTYFVAWASEYDPIFVHAGGSPGALRWLDRMGMDNVDALRAYGAGFVRASDREAPHNLYADTRELREVIEDDSDSGDRGSWGGLEFSDTPTVGSQEGVRVTVSYPGGYNVTYTYDEATGQYARDMLQEPHKDRLDGKRILASAVIVQSVDMRLIDGDSKGRLEAQLSGKGAALVFQNGRVTRGYWQKQQRDSPTVYTTADGRLIRLKRGQVWIQVAPSDGAEIEY